MATAGEAAAQGTTEVKARIAVGGAPPNGPFSIKATGSVEVATGDTYKGISFYLIDENNNVIPGTTLFTDPKKPQPVPGGGPVPVEGNVSNLPPGNYTCILVIEYLTPGKPGLQRATSSSKVKVPLPD